MSKSLDLWLTFYLNGTIYAIDCIYVKSISTLPEKLTEVSDVPEHIRGIIRFYNEIITIVGLRELFGMKTLKSEIEEFSEMMENRKSDHIKWVNTLNECIKTGSKFTLSDDPHKCEFGKWYDNYKSEISSVNFHLKKIEAPHRRLHNFAKGINNLILSTSAESKSKLEEISKNVSNVYMPKLLDLIEQTKYTYKESIREMMVVIENSKTSSAFAMDEIIGVEKLQIIQYPGKMDKINSPEYIHSVARGKNSDSIIMILDVPMILNKITSYEKTKEKKEEEQKSNKNKPSRKKKQNEKSKNNRIKNKTR